MNSGAPPPWGPSGPSNSAPPPVGHEGSTALVLRKPDALADDVRMQHLWLSLQQRSWRTLAVVGATKGIATLNVANELAKVAWWFTGQPSAVFDMRDLSLRLLEHQLRDMAAQVQGAERVFIALRSTSENPTAAPLARAADAAVLCVQLGKTDIRTAKRTIDAIGHQRFIGTLLVPATDEVDAPPVGFPSDMRPPPPDGNGMGR